MAVYVQKIFKREQINKLQHMLTIEARLNQRCKRRILVFPQGIQLELQLGRAQSDSTFSIFARANKSYSYICNRFLYDEVSASCSGLDASMQ